MKSYNPFGYWELRWALFVSLAGIWPLSEPIHTTTLQASQPPSPPQLTLSADSVLRGVIRLQWEVVDEATSYSIWRNTTDDFSTAVEVAADMDAAITIWDDRDAAFEVSYHYWLQASNEAGDSPPSESVSGSQHLVKWRIETGREFLPRVAYDPDRDVVYFTTPGYSDGESAGELYALTPEGGIQWQFPTEAGVNFAPVIDAEGIIYLAENEIVRAVGPDGFERWKFPVGGLCETSLAVHPQGLLIVGVNSDFGELIAINTSGKEVWRTPARITRGLSPAIGHNGNVYYMIGRDLYAYDLFGKYRWAVPGSGIANESGPAFDPAGNILFYSGRVQIQRIHPETGKPVEVLSHYPNANIPHGSPTIGPDGSMYYVSSRGYLGAVQPNGSLRWELKLTESIYSSPVLGESGALYVIGHGMGKAALYKVASSGTVQWYFPMASGGVRPAEAMPIITANGTLCLGEIGGTLYGLATADTLANGPWPRPGGDVRNTSSVAEPFEIEEFKFVGIVRDFQHFESIRFKTEINRNITVSASTDLQNWMQLTNFVSPWYYAIINDVESTSMPQRFYRINSFPIEEPQENQATETSQ